MYFFSIICVSIKYNPELIKQEYDFKCKNKNYYKMCVENEKIKREIRFQISTLVSTSMCEYNKIHIKSVNNDKLYLILDVRN